MNCAGPWFGKLTGPKGVKMSTTMLPTRIHVGHKNVDGPFLDLPFVADGWGASGIYFMPRRQNKQLVFGSVAHRFESEIVDPDDYNTALDPDVKQDYLNCLFHRLPTLPTHGEVRPACVHDRRWFCLPLVETCRRSEESERRRGRGGKGQWERGMDTAHFALQRHESPGA